PDVRGCVRFAPATPPSAPSSTLFPYTTLFRSRLFLDRDQRADLLRFHVGHDQAVTLGRDGRRPQPLVAERQLDPVFREADAAGEARKSTRLNSSHAKNSYAAFCLKKKTHIPTR